METRKTQTRAHARDSLPTPPPSRQPQLTDARRTELRDMLRGMGVAAAQFYCAAVEIGCHPFIEFTGLMNEYIKICAQAVDNNVDFANANTHSGNALPMRDYQMAYLAEKLDCILGPTFRAHPELHDIFTRMTLQTDSEVEVYDDPTD